MLVIEAALGGSAGEALPAWLLAVTSARRDLVKHSQLMVIKNFTHIFLRLHSAHACGVVMRFDVPLLDLLLSVESVDCFRGVTPWTDTFISHLPGLCWTEDDAPSTYMCGTSHPEWE